MEKTARSELLMVVVTALLGMAAAFLHVALHISDVVLAITGAAVSTLIGVRLSRQPLAGALVFCVVAPAATYFLQHP